MEKNSEKKYIELFSNKVLLLKQNRQFMWGVRDGVGLISHDFFQTIPKEYEEAVIFKDYVPSYIFEQFEKDYQMAIVLLEKCLLAYKDDNFIQRNEKAKQIIESLLIQIEENKDYARSEEIIEALKKEVSVNTLINLGLTVEEIEKVLLSGFTAKSVLDVEQDKTLN